MPIVHVCSLAQSGHHGWVQHRPKVCVCTRLPCMCQTGDSMITAIKQDFRDNRGLAEGAALAHAIEVAHR